MILFKTIIWAAKVRISEQITKRFLSFFERKQKQRRTQHLLGPPNNVAQITQKSCVPMVASDQRSSAQIFILKVPQI